MQPPEPPRKTHSSSGSTQPVLEPPPHPTLLSVLVNPDSKDREIKSAIHHLLNPKKFDEPYIEIGHLDQTFAIQCPMAMKMIFSHIARAGSSFPNIRFVRCQFSRSCFEAFLVYLPECARLQSLTFYQCGLQTEDVSALVASLFALKDNLQELAIINNPLPLAADLESIFDLFLKKTTQLQILNLSNNELTDAHALELAKVLIANKSVHTLRLDKNGITYDGASDLVNWLKGHRLVRCCSLVGNRLTPENQATLETLLNRHPCPLVFESKKPMPAPLPLQIKTLVVENKPVVNKALNDLKEMISSADDYEAWQWEMISKLSAQDKQSIYKTWLQIGFRIKEMEINQGEKGWLSFFKAVSMACGTTVWKDQHSLFNQTMDYILSHIDDFTVAIFRFYPSIPEGVPLGEYLMLAIFEKDQFPSEIFYGAVQAVMKQHNVLRPIHIYIQPQALESVSKGKLILPPTQRLETDENKGKEPILLYLGEENRYALLEKKRKP